MTIFDDLAFVPARTEHLKPVQDLLRRAFEPYVAKLGRRLSAEAYDWLPESLRRDDVYLVVREGAIVGVVAYVASGKDLLVDQIAVDPELQGGGVGAWMLAQTESLARERGYEALVLVTAEIMDDLLRFYRRHGFEEIGRAPPGHGRDRYPRVRFRKPL